MFDVFVISPYSDKNTTVVNERIEEAEKYIAALVKNGTVAYSVIAAMAHITDKYDIPDDYDYWKKHCEQMIASSKEVHVLQLEGWKQSEGVIAEMGIAVDLGKDITFVHPTGKHT